MYFEQFLGLADAAVPISGVPISSGGSRDLIVRGPAAIKNVV